jgi:hypothetical protein
MYFTIRLFFPRLLFQMTADTIGSEVTHTFFAAVKAPNAVWGLYVVTGNNKILFGPAQFICKAS